MAHDKSKECSFPTNTKQHGFVHDLRIQLNQKQV